MARRLDLAGHPLPDTQAVVRIDPCESEALEIRFLDDPAEVVVLRHGMAYPEGGLAVYSELIYGDDPKVEYPIAVVAKNLMQARHEAWRAELGIEGRDWVAVSTTNHARGHSFSGAVWSSDWWVGHSDPEHLRRAVMAGVA